MGSRRAKNEVKDTISYSVESEHGSYNSHSELLPGRQIGRLLTFIPPHDRELRELKLILQLSSTCILSDAFHRTTEYMGNIDCYYAVSHGQQSKVTIKLGLIDSMTNGLPHWGWCFPGLQPGERSIVGPSALRFSPYACLALAYISSITSPPRPPTNWMSSTPVSSGSSAKDPSATGYQGGMQEMDFGGTRSGD